VRYRLRRSTGGRNPPQTTHPALGSLTNVYPTDLNGTAGPLCARVLKARLPTRCWQRILSGLCPFILCTYLEGGYCELRRSREGSHDLWTRRVMETDLTLRAAAEGRTAKESYEASGAEFDPEMFTRRTTLRSPARGPGC
jgi:hypothetical protein